MSRRRRRRVDLAWEYDEAGADLRVDLRTVATLCRDADQDAWPELVVERLPALPTDALTPSSSRTPRPCGPPSACGCCPAEALRAPTWRPPSARRPTGSVRSSSWTPRTRWSWPRPTSSTCSTCPPCASCSSFGATTSAHTSRWRYEERADSPVDLLVAEGDSFYTATSSLLLDEAIDLPADGALVVVPSRHALVAHPLRDGHTVPAVRRPCARSPPTRRRTPRSADGRPVLVPGRWVAPILRRGSTGRRPARVPPARQLVEVLDRCVGE